MSSWSLLVSLVGIGQAQELPWTSFGETGGQTGIEFFDVHNPQLAKPCCPPLVSDRPYFAPLPYAVSPGTVQAELGYQFIYDDRKSDGAVRRGHVAPELLLRLGVAESIELRAGWTWQWEETDRGATTVSSSGSRDFLYGAKIVLTEQDQSRPQQALLLMGTLPLQDDLFSTGGAEWGADYLFGWSLADVWKLYGATGFMTSKIGPDNFVDWHQSLVVEVSVGTALSLFSEYAGTYSADLADNRDQHRIAVGLKYLWNENMQFDLRAGTGLNNASNDFVAGTGLALRF